MAWVLLWSKTYLKKLGHEIEYKKFANIRVVNVKHMGEIILFKNVFEKSFIFAMENHRLLYPYSFFVGLCSLPWKYDMDFEYVSGGGEIDREKEIESEG